MKQIRLRDCTPEETLILAAVVALSGMLEGEPARYGPAFAEMRREMNGVPR